DCHIASRLYQEIKLRKGRMPMLFASTLMSLTGHFRQIGAVATLRGCPLRPESGHWELSTLRSCPQTIAHTGAGARCTAGFQSGLCLLRVSRVGWTLCRRSRHVRFAPKADKWADIVLGPLCAKLTPPMKTVIDAGLVSLMTRRWVWVRLCVRSHSRLRCSR